MFAIRYLFSGKFLAGLIVGVISGFVFGFVLYIYFLAVENHFNKKCTEISCGREIICEGPANVFGKVGWLYLFEDALEYYPKRECVNNSRIIIKIEIITDVFLKREYLTVKNQNADAVFRVEQPKAWLEILLKIIKAGECAPALISPLNYIIYFFTYIWYNF